jgi:hypothetical protein
MLGSVVRRERLPLWALVSFVAILGFAVSTLLAEAAHTAALDGVVQRGRHAATLLTETVSDKQLADPIKGASYDKLAARIHRTVSPVGSSVDVTVWSLRGQILFSLDRPLVGTKDLETQPLISEMSNGSGSYRTTDGSVRAFVPVALATKDRVVLVEVDEPLAAVEARVGNIWNILRVAFTFVLAVSLLVLGLTFVSSMKRPVAKAVEERAEGREDEVAREASAEAKAEPPVAEQPVTEQPVTEQPVTEQPVTEQPAAKEQVPDQPVTGKTTASFTQALEALQALQPDLEHAIHGGAGAKHKEPAAQAVPDEAAKQDVAKQEEPAAAAVPDEVATDEAPTEEEVQQDAPSTVEASNDVDAAAELMRKRREELKARAAKAELRVKKLDSELQQAGSGPRSEQ